jgi:hypothetical protein
MKKIATHMKGKCPKNIPDNLYKKREKYFLPE